MSEFSAVADVFKMALADHRERLAAPSSGEMSTCLSDSATERICCRKLLKLVVFC